MVRVTESEHLAVAADTYRRAVQQADELKRQASADLTAAVRAAYANGMKKSEILRATDHVWSRTWLDEALKEASQ